MAVVGAIIMPHPAMLLPEVGRGRERQLEKTATACREAARRVAAWRPETLVIASPHTISYADYIHISPGEMARGDFEAFGAPEVELMVKYDGPLIEGISRVAMERGVPAGTWGERKKALDHGTLVPLRFLREAGVACPVVRLGLSGLPALDHYQMGMCLAEAARRLDRRVVFVASGDLSHRISEDCPSGFDSQSPAFYARMSAAMGTTDFLEFLSMDERYSAQAANSGLRAFQIMAGTLDGMAVEGELLSNEEMFGTGYGVAVFTPAGLDGSRHFGRVYETELLSRLTWLRGREDPWEGLARTALETYVRTGQGLTEAELPTWTGQAEELSRHRAGVFVSIHKGGRLRGCVGTICPVKASVGEEIVCNAVSAGTSDPRFEPVRPEELEFLTYCVDVLEPPERVMDLTELDARQYGVIVTSGERRGLLLPNLEGVETPEQQVEIARQKAGIWPQEPCRIERFRVIRHSLT